MIVSAVEKPFEKVIVSLRRFVKEVDDFRMAIRLASAIAGVTHDRHDILFALHKAKSSQSSDLRSEGMAIVAKTLAEAQHFEDARKVVEEMVGANTYWKAEACIWIFRFSGEDQDLKVAENAIDDIQTPYLRNEAREDLNLLSKKYHRTGHQNPAKHHSDFLALKALLAEVQSLKEDSHKVRPRFNSVYLRFKTREIIDRVLAETFSQ